MNITPYKEAFVNPKAKPKHAYKAKNQEQRLVSSPDLESTELPVIDSRYEVLELIGRGGMGCVYKVQETETGNIFAIKVVQPDLAVDQSSLKRFEQEVEATCRLTHPHLVPTLNQGRTADGAPYLVMEYVEGENLAAIIKHEGRLEPGRVLKLWQQICEALTYAHEHGIIHRDIKPNNIIVSRNRDGSETARLVDFGIAKVFSAQDRQTHDLTETGAVFGNPYYMSPEHCLSFKMDERSDIYSLGCLMYELLTGHPPFEASTPVQVIVKHINDQAKPFSADFKADPISEKLDGVTLRCLEKEPERRYQSVNDLAKDLELIAEGKKPAKHKVKKSARPEFTRSQIIAVVLAISLVVGNTRFLHGWFSYTSILMLFCAVGCWAFSRDSIVRLKSIFAGNVTARNCWSAALLVSLAAMCWFYLPGELLHLLAIKLPWLDFSIMKFLHKIALLSTLISAVGCVLFRSTFKTAVWKVGMQFATVVAALLLIAATVVPKETSGELYTSLRGVYRKAPWVTSSVMPYAVALDPTNKSAVFELADSLASQNNIKEAVSIFDSYLKIEKDKEKLADAYFTRSKLYMLPEQTQAKVDDLNAAIKLSPHHQYFEQLGLLSWEAGRDAEALHYFEQAKVCQPSAGAPYCGIALVYSSQGDYSAAIKELDQMDKFENDKQQIGVFFLRALLKEKLHDPGAKDDFQTVIRRSEDKANDWKDDLIDWDRDVRAAYSYKALGDNANYLKKMEMVKTFYTGNYEKSKDELDRSVKRANLNL